MNRIYIAIIALIMAPLAMAQYEPQPPTVFSSTALTAEQVAAAKDFKEKRGDVRTQEWATLQPLFPRYHTTDAAPNQVRVVEHPSVIMTTADLVSLLGEPTTKTNATWTYSLGWIGDNHHMISFTIDNEQVGPAGYRILNP